MKAFQASLSQFIKYLPCVTGQQLPYYKYLAISSRLLQLRVLIMHHQQPGYLLTLQ